MYTCCSLGLKARKNQQSNHKFKSCWNGFRVWQLVIFFATYSLLDGLLRGLEQDKWGHPLKMLFPALICPKCIWLCVCRAPAWNWEVLLLRLLSFSFLFLCKVFGSLHGEELAYGLGMPLTGGSYHLKQNYTFQEQVLSEVMMHYWANFARTG